MATAQTDSFDVTVNPNLTQSQRQVTAQGSISLAASTLQLRSLDFLTDALREAERERRRDDEDRSEDEESVNANRFPQSPVAGLGAAWLSAGAVAGGSADTEVGAEFARFNAFGNVDYRFAERDRTSNAPANDANMLSLTAGADYRVNPDLVLGAILGYVANDTDFTTGNNGQLELDSYSVSGLAAWYPWRNLYLDAIARAAINEFDASRRLVGGGTATGDTDGFEYAFSASTGYEFYRGPVNFGPLARVTYTDVSIDGYRERGGANPLIYEDQDVESLRTALGADMTSAVNTDFGVVLSQFGLEWVHEFEDDPRLVVAQPASGGTRFGIPVDPRDSDFYRFSMGVTTVLTHGRTLFFRYETDIARDNRENHTLTLGARLEL